MLQRLGGGLENPPAGLSGARERDLVGFGVGRHPGAKVIPSANHIQNTGRKDLTNVVGGSKHRKRGKDRRLQDNGVAGQQSWEHFCE